MFTTAPRRVDSLTWLIVLAPCQFGRNEVRVMVQNLLFLQMIALPTVPLLWGELRPMPELSLSRQAQSQRQSHQHLKKRSTLENSATHAKAFFFHRLNLSFQPPLGMSWFAVGKIPWRLHCRSGLDPAVKVLTSLVLTRLAVKVQTRMAVKVSARISGLQ